MPITPESADRFFRGIFGPINRAAEPLTAHKPSAVDVINRRINSPVAGKPGAPTMSQQLIGAVLSSLAGIGPARTGPGAFRGLPEFPVTERLWTDPHTGQIYKVPGYDARRSVTNPQDTPPPSPGRSGSSSVNLEDDIRNELIARRVKLLEEEQKLTDAYSSRWVIPNSYRRQLYADINRVRDEVEKINTQIDTVGGHSFRDMSFEPVNHFPGRRRHLGDRTNRSTRGSEGSRPSSEVRSMVESRQADVDKLMRSSGYELTRDRSSRTGSRYRIYEDSQPNLPLTIPESGGGSNRFPNRNRFEFRFGDHPAHRFSTNPNLSRSGVGSGRSYDVSIGSRYSNIENLEQHLLPRIGLSPPLQRPQTPIPPEQLNFLQQLLGGP